MENFPYILALYTLAFLAGGAVASFAQVVAYRVPRGMSFVHGRSICPCCGHVLRARDMVPVLGWLCLGGRCRFCRAKIPATLAQAEALGGALAVLAFHNCGPTWRAVAVACFLLCLLALSLFDLATMEIPGGFLIALSLPALALAAMSDLGPAAHLIGAAVFPLPLFVTALLVKDSFGGGDIKLAAVCGLALGWKCSLAALFFALLSGGIYAVFQLASKKMQRGQHFAFGPYLALGSACALLWGDAVVRWYSSLLVY